MKIPLLVGEWLLGAAFRVPAQPQKAWRAQIPRKKRKTIFKTVGWVFFVCANTKKKKKRVSGLGSESMLDAFLMFAVSLKEVV